MDHDFDTDEVRAGRFHEEHYAPFGKSSPALAAAARLMGILSLFFFWMIYLALPLAATSIVLALLSRGAGKVKHRVRGIIITGIFSMVLTTGVTTYSVYKVFTTPSLKMQMDIMVRYYLGESLDDILGGDSAADDGKSAQDSLPDNSGEANGESGQAAPGAAETERHDTETDHASDIITEDHRDDASADNGKVPTPLPSSFGQEGGYL